MPASSSSAAPPPPPLAQDRVRLRADGRVLVALKTVWRDGTSHVLVEPIEFLEKLATIIPRPAVNLLLSRRPRPGQGVDRSNAPPLVGRRPVGWRAPAWQLSAKSLDLVTKRGFEYPSTMMDRLVPYLHPEAHDVTNFTSNMDAETSRAFHTSMNTSPSTPITEPS